MKQAEKLLDVCESLLKLDLGKAKLPEVKHALEQIKTKIEEVVKDHHPDDDAQTHKKLQASLEHLKQCLTELGKIK